MQKHFKSQSRLWDYAILKKLGKGTSGQVFQVQHNSTKQIYALKKIPITATQDRQKLNAFKEIKCLSLLDHPSIIAYHQSFLSMDHIYIVMEYANKGDFSKIIQQRKRKEKYFTQTELWTLYGQIINAVKYLHEKNVIHRDIKLENIFMTSEQKLKLGDLGMSKIMMRSDQLISTRVGTPIYFAPQMIQNQLYSFPVDIWALGCVLYYLAALEHPFHQATIQTLGYYAIDRPLKPINGRYSVQLINFINSCFEKQPNKRPNIFQLALKIKTVNDQSSSPHKYNNRISILNIKQLNKLFNVQQTKNNFESNKKREIKPKTQRDLSINFKSQRKIYTSLSGRNPLKQQKQTKQDIQRKGLRSSCQNRVIKDNYFNLECPQTPSLPKKYSHQQKQQNYRTNKMATKDLETQYSPPFTIKTNGFTLHMINKTQRTNNSNQFNNQKNELDILIHQHQKVPLSSRLIRAQRSHR